MLFMSFYKFGPDIPTGHDKVNHVAGFLLFSLLMEWAWPRIGAVPTILYGLGLGLFIEIVQYFLPYRSTEFLDVAADSIGLALGVVIIYGYSKIGHVP